MHGTGAQCAIDTSASVRAATSSFCSLETVFCVALCCAASCASSEATRACAYVREGVFALERILKK